MEGLLKRISAEGSEAENALRVVAFYDELVAHRGALDALVRSTARLIGAPAGFESRSGSSSWSFDAIGRPYPTVAPTGARRENVSTERGLGGIAWILPDTSNDSLAELVLERMAISAAIVLERHSGQGTHAEETSLTRLLDPRNSLEDHRLDAQLLGFRSTWKVRVAVARDRSGEASSGRRISGWSQALGVRSASAEMDGGLTVVLLHDTDQWAKRDAASWGCLVGLGSSELVEDAWRSLETAQRALRLCSADLGPRVVDYEGLGPLTFVTAVPPSDAAKEPCVQQLALLLETESGRAELRALDAFCKHTSLRAAAAELNLHHSSLASRLRNLGRRLGKDVAAPEERFLLTLSLQLLRISRSL